MNKLKPDALGRRPWTMKELRWLRENYAALGPGRCAELLERTHTGVINQAAYHGIGKPISIRAEIEPRIRALHAEGKSDAQIAVALGWVRSGRRRVQYWRSLFALPPHPQDCRRDGARGTKVACRNNDAKTLVAIRYEKERYDAARLGWFGANSMAQVAVLETLRDGPFTAREIIERQGKRFRKGGGAYNNLRAKLAHLIKVGLVVVQKGSQLRYSLAHHAESLEEAS